MQLYSSGLARIAVSVMGRGSLALWWWTKHQTGRFLSSNILEKDSSKKNLESGLASDVFFSSLELSFPQHHSQIGPFESQPSIRPHYVFMRACRLCSADGRIKDGFPSFENSRRTPFEQNPRTDSIGLVQRHDVFHASLRASEVRKEFYQRQPHWQVGESIPGTEKKAIYRDFAYAQLKIKCGFFRLPSVCLP